MLAGALGTTPQAQAQPVSVSSQSELQQWHHDPFGAMVWGLLKGAVGLVQSDPLVHSVVSQYAMGPIWPEAGPIAELTECANAVTSSNPTGAARYAGAGVCMLAKPGLKQRFQDYINGYGTWH